MKATAEMYNLKEDPLELHNRINDNATPRVHSRLFERPANLIHDWTQQVIDRPHYKKAANLFTPKGM